MNAVLAVSDGVIFALGSLVFIAVFTAALGLAYVRFAELDGDRAPDPDDRTP